MGTRLRIGGQVLWEEPDHTYFLALKLIMLILSTGTSKNRSPVSTVIFLTSIIGDCSTNLLPTTAPCVRLLFITMNMDGGLMNFFLRLQIWSVGKFKPGPCQPSFTSTSHPNSLPLPFTKRSIP